MSLIIIVLLIVANGVFAMSEIAVVSANKVRLRSQAEAGSRPAARALELAENPTRFLATVQVGITLIGVFAGAYGATTLATPIAEWLAGVPWLAPYSGALALVGVVGGVTYLSAGCRRADPQAHRPQQPRGYRYGRGRNHARPVARRHPGGAVPGGLH